ncbi:MAG: hypothetical protein SGPRY_012635, partial [Prymnesium sp.]
AVPNNALNNTGITVGFTLGLALFLLVGKYCAPDDIGKSLPVGSPEEPFAMGTHPTTRGPAGKIAMVKRLLSVRLYHPPFPLPLFFAVSVDSFVDGFLIGLSSASGKSSGIGAPSHPLPPSSLLAPSSFRSSRPLPSLLPLSSHPLEVCSTQAHTTP